MIRSRPHPTYRPLPSRRQALAIVAWFVACLGVPAVAQAPADGPTDLDLYLLIGQSNMAGRGKPVPADQSPHPRVFSMNAEGNWVPAADPLHFDKPTVVGVGLGLTFGTEIALANPAAKIGLIPCAVGGSPIDAWTPETFYPPTQSHPWDDAIRRVRLALRNGKLRGILWHQGESDCTPDLASDYQAKLDNLISRLRTELDSNEVPFIVGQLGRFPERPWSDSHHLVDQALRNLPERIPRTAFVSAEGLTHGGDQVHFAPDSYREFGRRYAAAYLRVISP